MEGQKLGGRHLNKSANLYANFEVLCKQRPLLFGGIKMIIQPKVPDAKLLEYIYDAAKKYKEIMEQPFLFGGKVHKRKLINCR